MNSRRVARELAKLHLALVLSIKDEEVAKLVKERTVITGGSIVSLLLSEWVKDYDLYFTDKETTLRVAEYYVELFKKNRKALRKQDIKRTSNIELYVTKDNKRCSKDSDFDRIRIKIPSAGVIGEDSEEENYGYFESQPDELGAETYINEAMREAIQEADAVDGGLLDTYENSEGELFRPVFLSDNAITLSGKVQIVIRFYGSPDQIHENFDFVHCTNYWESRTKQLVLNPAAIESVLTRDLRYVGSKYPVCSVIRLRRFLKKGWFANAGQILKILMQISKLNLEDVGVLDEQLTGVDTAYFFEMVRILKAEQKKLKKQGKSIDQTYIATIIDRIF